MDRKTKKEVRFTFPRFNPNTFRNSDVADYEKDSKRGKALLLIVNLVFYRVFI